MKMFLVLILTGVSLISCETKPAKRPKTYTQKLDSVAAPFIANEIGDLKYLTDQFISAKNDLTKQQYTRAEIVKRFPEYMYALRPGVTNENEARSLYEAQASFIVDKNREMAALLLYKDSLRNALRGH